MTTYILIFLIVFLIGIYFVITQNEKESKVTNDLYQSLEKLDKVISNIGNIESHPNFDYAQTSKDSNYLKVKMLSHIFRYTHSKEKFWVEFIIESKSQENNSFSIEEIEFNVGENIQKSDLILLLEKVPQYMAPPYGNRYFSTKTHNSFLLTTKGQTFKFNARFNFDLNNETTLMSADSMKITLNILKQENGKYEISDTVILFDYFKNLKFSNIQEIDEQISWN